MAFTYTLPNSQQQVTILGAWDLGGDRAEVRYRVGNDPQVRTVRGWVSATANYYPPASYDAQGNLVAGAQPRAMTPAEKRAYVQQLITAVEDGPPAPTQVV